MFEHKGHLVFRFANKLNVHNVLLELLGLVSVKAGLWGSANPTHAS